jgi:hypothetical protein
MPYDGRDVALELRSAETLEFQNFDTESQWVIDKSGFTSSGIS